MHDTFYVEGLKEDHILRTHTSPVQIRCLQKKNFLLEFLLQAEHIDVTLT